MKRTAWISIAIVLIVLHSALAAPTKNSKFDKLSLQIVESLQAFYPVRSTEMGIHAYDHRLANYSSSSIKKMAGKLTDFEKRLYKYRGAKMSAHNKINYKLLKSNVDIALQDLKRIRWHQKSPQLYVDEAVNGIYFLMLSQHAPLKERLPSILSRMKAVSKLFATARKNLKNLPKVYIDAALESLESGLSFYKNVAADLSMRFPERADKILRVSTQAREAMNDFSAFLSDITPNNKTSFAIGKDNLDYKLAHEYYLDFDSDALLKFGQALLKKAQADYAEYEVYVESNHQSGGDSVFVPATFAKSDILDYYDWESRQVKLFLEENEIVTVPESIAPVEVTETPSFLRSMMGGIAYQPAGPFDSAQQGFFYVRPIPEGLDNRLLESHYRYVHRRGFKGSVVHEAYPGHHLQLQIAGMNPDPVRKWQFNKMSIEGWALYCEEMMYEQGLFGENDPAQWLGVLGGIRFRAARIVADVSLHTGRMTYDECVSWMIEALDITTESDRQYIETEVRRYTLTPTYQMAYLMGKLEIMSLRSAAMKKAGDKFSLRDFHDKLLAEGSIPPTLMWRVMGLKRTK